MTGSRCRHLERLESARELQAVADQKQQVDERQPNHNKEQIAEKKPTRATNTKPKTSTVKAFFEKVGTRMDDTDHVSSFGTRLHLAIAMHAICLHVFDKSHRSTPRDHFLQLPFTDGLDPL